MSRSRFLARYAGAWAVLLAGWLAAAYGFVPRLIRSAYRGESVSFLNTLISGQDQHPVERYLNAWGALVPRATLGLLALAVLTGAAWVYRDGLRRVLRRAFWADPGLGPAAAARMAIWFGILTGVATAIPVLGRQAIQKPAQDLVARELVWIAPVSAIVTSLAVVAVLWLILRTGGRPSAKPFLFLLLTLTVFTPITVLATGLHELAALLLAAGIAARLTTLIVRRFPSFDGVVRRTAGWGLAGLAAIAVGMHGQERLSESRALAGLPAPAAGAVNVLLIVLDTVRAESLSLYGYGRPTTPELEAFAGEGVTFERALATAPWTLPSHASMFTGRWHHEMSADWETRLDDRWPTLAEVLSARGYRTAGIVGNLWYCASGTGLERGFARYSDHAPTPVDILKSTWLGNRFHRAYLALTGGHPGSRSQRLAPSVTEEFLGWVGEGERPFFAFLNYSDAHHPYHMPPPFDTAFAEPAPRWWLARWGTAYEPEELEELRDAYDSSIAYLDHELGRVFETLAARGILDNTLVVVASDHGEQFGEHGLAMHGNSLYTPLLRVPLVMRLPGRVPSGVRVEEPVSIRDIPATILALTGADPGLPGTDLAGYWREGGLRATPSAIQAHVSENDFALETDPVYEGPMSSAVLGGLSLIRNGDGTEELYDLMTDLSQHDNLIGSAAHAAALERLRSVLPDSPRRVAVAGRAP